MKPIVSLLTCTGHRPEALELCEKYMRRQTYRGPMQHIIIDDSLKTNPLVTNDPLDDGKIRKEVYKGPTLWEKGYNTQRDNMNKALSQAKGEYILIIEDEDYYQPTYVETMVKLLSITPAAGEVCSKYYHLGVPGWKEMFNYQHASLCQTGLRKELLPALKAAVNSGELYFDIIFWKALRETKTPVTFTAESNLVIGIKGMPGREGIGIGHNTRDYFLDLNASKLREWCGSDIDLYLPFALRKSDLWKKPTQLSTSSLRL